jgi:hypothetical protein
MCACVLEYCSAHTLTIRIPPVHGEVQLDEFSTAVRGHLRAGGDLLNKRLRNEITVRCLFFSYTRVHDADSTGYRKSVQCFTNKWIFIQFPRPDSQIYNVLQYTQL